MASSWPMEPRLAQASCLARPIRSQNPGLACKHKCGSQASLTKICYKITYKVLKKTKNIAQKLKTKGTYLLASLHICT